MLRVLDAFKLTTPTTAPAQLLKVLLLERWPDVIIWEGRRGGSNAGEQVRRALAKMREAGHPQLEAIAPAQVQCVVFARYFMREMLVTSVKFETARGRQARCTT